MLYLLSKHPDLNIITESDFRLAFKNEWFVYANALIRLMPDDSLKLFISAEIFHLIMPNADQKLLTSLFIKASNDVQKLIIEDLLRHFATNDEYDAFIMLFETKIIEPKLFTNGETLFTSLLRDKNVKYCWAIIHHATNINFFNLANELKQMPLQIAIETELYDLICPMIFRCDQLNKEDIDWNTALIQLFQKLSIGIDISSDEKLMAAIKTIISRGGDIYKETSPGKNIIDLCSRLNLRNEIEAFTKKEGNRDDQMKDRAAPFICKICFDRELDCVFDCGHTLCTPCSDQLYRCPMCNAELMNRKRFYI